MKTNNIAIHIFGASGTGTTSLGKEIAQKLNISHFDADDYLWQKTDPPFSVKQPKDLRIKNLDKDISMTKNWILSGSFIRWGESFIPLFSAAVFLSLPQDIRLERLRRRETKKHGSRIEIGGDMYDIHKEFMAYAKNYDSAGLEMRSRVSHENWIAKLTCPIIRKESTKPVEVLATEIITDLKLLSFQK